MDESSESVAKAFKTFDETIKSVEEAMRPLLAAVDAIRQSEDPEQIPALTKARVHATLAYAVNALYYVYLRANSAETEAHPIASEIERVQNLFSRLRAVERAMPKDDEDKKVRTMRKSVKKLDAFLTPEEEDLFHAVKGNTSKRQRHKRFPSENAPDTDKKSMRKKRKMRGDAAAVDDAMVDEEPAATPKAAPNAEPADMAICTPNSKMDVADTPAKLGNTNEPSVKTPETGKSAKSEKKPKSSKKKGKKGKKAK